MTRKGDGLRGTTESTQVCSPYLKRKNGRSAESSASTVAGQLPDVIHIIERTADKSAYSTEREPDAKPPQSIMFVQTA